jgi:CMP-N-acetylneuraminic acid synthetase
MRILGIIPARGGSKGIKSKNLSKIKGRTLLEYAIRAARESQLLDRFIVSSDNQQIIRLAKRLKADAPFKRPQHLSTDRASSAAVAIHALKYVEQHEKRKYDAVCLIQPTCPLRRSHDIDRAIKLLIHSKRIDSVVSVSDLSEPHPRKLFKIKKGVLKPFLSYQWNEKLRRQDLETLYFLNGAVYCTLRKVLLKRKSLWGRKTRPYLMPPERSVNVDRPKDLILARFFMES